MNCLREPVAKLTKAQVEALLATYDSAPIDSLTTVLRIALDAPTLDWVALLELAGFSDMRRQRLLRGEPAALDELAGELNEVREVSAHRLRFHSADGGDCAPPIGRQPR